MSDDICPEGYIADPLKSTWCWVKCDPPYLDEYDRCVPDTYQRDLEIFEVKKLNHPLNAKRCSPFSQVEVKYISFLTPES